MPVVNLLAIATTPGAEGGNPFTPPADWQGDAEAYKSLMRERFKERPFGLHMMVAARMSRKVAPQYSGAFAAEAMQILNSLKSRG